MTRLSPLLFLALVPTTALAQRSRSSGPPSSSTASEVQHGPGDLLRQAPFEFEFLPISARDQFGSSMVSIGDLDGDGHADLAVGTPEDDAGTRRGTLWILFLDAAGQVARWKYVNPPRPFASGQTYAFDLFGSSLAALGDLDGDGRPELAVGAPATETSPQFGNGKVWILSLDPDGGVYAQHAITEGESGFGEDLEPTDRFGSSLEALGDLDGDGVGDLAVGAQLDFVGGIRTGSVRVLFLNADGTVKSVATIAAGVGGFTGALDGGDAFGASLAVLEDLDADGNPELVVGAPGDDDTTTPNVDKGALWVLFLNVDGSVRAHQKVSETQGNLGLVMNPGSEFGCSADAFDLEGDGTPELLVGARGLADGAAPVMGAVLMLSLASDGTVLLVRQYGRSHGGVTGLTAGVRFGAAVAAGGDIDGNGFQDFFVGLPLRAKTLCLEPGALYRLLLDPLSVVADQYEVGGRCLADENFGNAAVEIGDLTGDGQAELAVGAPGLSNQNTESGSVWIFSPDERGKYEPFVNLLPDTTALTPSRFGVALAAPGDIDQDGNPDLAVGADGRLYVMRLNANGSVKVQKTFLSGLTTPGFGKALTAIGDLDGDGIAELVAGAPETRAGTHSTRGGAILVVFLNADGTRRSVTFISMFEGGFFGYLPPEEAFGTALAGLGDLDGDGFEELAVGSPSDPAQVPFAPGSVWVLSLSPAGTVVREVQITYGLAGLSEFVAPGSRFGSGLVNVGDLDGDGLPELLVAASGDDTSGPDQGALWLLFLRADGTVRTARKLQDGQGLGGNLQSGAEFGHGLALLSSPPGSPRKVFVGAPFDDRTARNAGTSWILSLFAR